MNSAKRRALFPGTFDPFTRGHASLVTRGLTLADEVVIAVGENESKKSYFSLQERLEMLRSLYADEPRIRVESYSSLTVEFAQEIEAHFLLRGIRSIADFEYEKQIADINRMLAPIETVLLFCEPEFAAISSTTVRELLRYGKSVASFLPEGMKLPQKKE